MVSKELVSYCPVCNSSQSDIIETTNTMMGQQQDRWNFRGCKACSVVYLSPRVVREKLGDFYTEAYLPYRGSEAWGKFAHLVEGDQKSIDSKRVETVKKYIANNTQTILDVGCGKPTFLLNVHEKLKLSSIGIDFSDEGWKAEPDLYQELDLYVGEIDHLSADIQADIITMWHYLEHDYNPKNTLSVLNKSQKKDTTLIIEVPNFDSFTRRKYGEYWSGYHSPRHTVLYSPDTIRKLLDQSGWEVIDQYTYGTLDPYTLDWMSRMEKRRIDWGTSMEPYFYGYVLGKLMRPRYFFHKYASQGFMTIVAKNKG